MRSTPRRTFWIALAVSLVVHAVMLAGLPGWRSSAPTPSTTLDADLRPPPPPAPASAATVPPPVRPVSKPPSAPRAVVATPAPRTVPTPAPAGVVDQAPPPEPAPVAEAPQPIDTPEPPAADPVAQTPIPRPAPEPIDVAPSAGTISYDLFYGGGGSIGRSVQTWHIDRSSYRLTSLSEPIGLVALFLPYEYAYTSEGRVGPAGLQPERFTARSGRGGSRQSAATFDWEQRRLSLGPLGAQRTQDLAAGTQDLLSFVYQIALSPDLAPGRREMVITSGTKVDTYVLEIGQEEAIDLPVGPTRAIPIRRITAAGEEGMQLWLTATPPRLPVRIVFYDRSGKKTIEQLAARIERNGS